MGPLFRAPHLQGPHLSKSPCFHNFVTESTLGKSEIDNGVTPDMENKRIYFHIIDKFLFELDHRFTQNMPLIEAMMALDCKFSRVFNMICFLPFSILTRTLTLMKCF